MEQIRDLQHALAALSARQTALELLLAAVVRHATVDRKAAVAEYDRLAEETRDRYQGLPVGDAVIELVEQACAEVRELLG